MGRFVMAALTLGSLFMSLGAAALPCPVSAGPPQARLAFAAYHSGQWDLFSIRPDGSDLRQMTNHSYEDRDPAFSPDGTQLAYSSRRDRNWDIYLLDLNAGRERRLTTDPAYDGAPAWSPDGTQIVFESMRAGDLDIWVLDLASGEVRNLTADSPAADFAPAWRPDGRHIAFTSWRSGDKDLFLIEVDTERLTQLTADAAAEEWPAWRPDGRQLAYVRNRLGEREVFIQNMPGDGRADWPGAPATWFGRDDSPAWAPEGDRLAFVNHRYDGEALIIRAIADVHDQPVTLVSGAWLDGRVSWSNHTPDYGTPLPSLADTEPSPLYYEDVTPSSSGDGEPWDLVELKDTWLPTPAMTPYLSDRVDDSFQAVRRRLADEVGYSFLDELSEAYRPYQHRGEAAEYSSWHKSGRAIDTLFDLRGASGQQLVIARDDMAGETFWRVYLRCADQTGACGRPLTADVWDYSRRARTQLAPQEGGVENHPSGQYYVDLTAIMREYGWARIAAWDRPEFSWRWHFKGFEYWHFQKTQGLSWYAAMLEVIAPSKVKSTFSYEQMIAAGDHPFTVALKGVPLPAPVRLWWTQVYQ
jgi:TolB protein